MIDFKDVRRIPPMSTSAHVDGFASQPALTTPALRLQSEQSPSRGGNTQFRKEGTDWVAIFNLDARSPNAQPGRTLDVDLVHSMRHESVVCCVRFSPDGNYLATGCNHTTQVYDVATGEKVVVFADDSMPRSEDLYIRSLCFSPDGRYLATGAGDGNIRIWSMHTHRLHMLLHGHTNEVYTLEYSPDALLLISGSGDKTMRVWSMHNDLTIHGQEQVFVIDVPPSGGIQPASDRSITSLAISPNSKLVAAASLDNVIRIWDVQARTLVGQLEGHTDSVYSVAFARNGSQVVSGSLDRTVKRWDVTPLYYPPQQQQQQRWQCEHTYSGHQDYVLCVALSCAHDATHPAWVISGSKDRSVMFWDITQTGATSVPEFTLKGHRNSVISVDASPALAGGGGLFATGGGDWEAKICVWLFSHATKVVRMLLDAGADFNFDSREVYNAPSGSGRIGLSHVLYSSE